MAIAVSGLERVMGGMAFSGWQITLTISKISLCTAYTTIAIAVIAAIAIWRNRKGTDS